MDFNEFQQKCRGTAVYRDATQQYIPRLSYVVSGLCSEAGEVAGAFKRVIRDDLCVMTEPRALAMKDELGDTLYYLAMVAFELGYNLEDIARENVEKLQRRMESGKINGQGNR